ncbi:MAG TPA: hypothetical protein PKM61_07810, partial [bacterium]|nr:hypothetical protein [bacterium]
MRGLRTLTIALGLVMALGCLSAVRAQESGTLGPWRVGDMAYNPTLADDRPNAESAAIKARGFTPLIPDRVLKGTKGALSFRVSPRNEEWAGILVMDVEGKPLGVRDGYSVQLVNPVDGKTAPFDVNDSRALFSDASRIFRPKTVIRVSQKNVLVDEATVDFTSWKYPDSKVRMNDLLDGPTSAHGFVTARDGRFWREGKPIYFWGGHENHVPRNKAASDLYAEAYSAAGINIMRHIGVDEMVIDPVSGAVNPEMLDNYLYLVAKLGEKGIYFLMSGYLGYQPSIYGLPKGSKGSNAFFWMDPAYRESWKKFLRILFTTKNPYNGKALKDDPTLIGFELSNEMGMNERRFDYNRLDTLEETQLWRQAFNRFLLKKYGNREALARAWEINPLLPNEDPTRGSILMPSNFRGVRSPYGGTGQHDQFTIGHWYRNGLPNEAAIRILDAIEFNQKVAGKTYPFDFNNLETPEETGKLRAAFNQFLLQKYGDRAALAKAWAEDQLFGWEDPAKNTILIPTNYRGEKEYRFDPSRRQADPRVSDALEFTYQVQKEWATDMARFLKDEIGLKCGVGWNGDTFHVVQTPNHLANMNSPLDIAIAAAYLDWDNGDQITSRTKNLKRFTAYGRILGRPMHSYEWSMWTRQGPYTYEYGLLAALMGRVYGFDGYSHHKMAPVIYPISDPLYSLNSHYITPLTDRRRGAFYVARWILERSRIPEAEKRLVIGFPAQSVFTGGPERRMSNWAFENWLMYQCGTEDYAFEDVYDGPADRVVVHSGHGPYGDYRKAQHAILWCHSNSDREGKDLKAREKWFALHGIKFAPGQKYYLDDKYFATTEDLTDYNLVHARAEGARWDLLNKNAASKQFGVVNTAAGDYWLPEKGQPLTEMDRKLYEALKRWGYPLPFEVEEIDQVWRSRDRTMEMNTLKTFFKSDRDDLQLWFGQLAENGGRVSLSRLEAVSGEKQYSAALIPWDTADFATARTLLLWTHWNSRVTVKLPFRGTPEIYAVNWLGKRLYRVKPLRSGRNELTFETCRDDD